MAPPVDVSLELRLMADDPWQVRARPVRRRFTQIVDAFERVRARYAVCGAVAMGAHGARRFTEDIDVLVAEQDIERVLETLAGSMQVVERQPPEGAVKYVRLRSRRARSTDSVEVDFLVPVNAIEAWALATAVRARWFDRKVDVVSAEALVILKLRAYLSEPEAPRSQMHRYDAVRVIRETALDVPALRRFVRDSPDLAAELERTLLLPLDPGRIVE